MGAHQSWWVRLMVSEQNWAQSLKAYITRYPKLSKTIIQLGTFLSTQTLSLTLVLSQWNGSDVIRSNSSQNKRGWEKSDKQWKVGYWFYFVLLGLFIHIYCSILTHASPIQLTAKSRAPTAWRATTNQNPECCGKAFCRPIAGSSLFPNSRSPQWSNGLTWSSNIYHSWRDFS